jgi:dipeptidase E
MPAARAAQRTEAIGRHYDRAVRLFLGSDGLGALPAFLGRDPRGLEVAFVPTGAKPVADKSFVERDRRALEALGMSIESLEIDDATPEEMRAALERADVVFVEGGTSFHLLERVRATGFAELLERVVRAGKPFVGMSGGALIAGPDLSPMKPISREARTEPTRALGLVEFVVYPHYDEERRAAAFPRVVAEYSRRFPLVPLTDHQALVVEGESARVVPS